MGSFGLWITLALCCGAFVSVYGSGSNLPLDLLRRAFHKGDLQLIKKFINHGYKPSADESQKTAFHYLLEGRKRSIDFDVSRKDILHE